MIVISDTTPLISLMKICYLDLLQQYFNEVQIPSAVYNELVPNLKYQEEAELIKASPFIRIVQINDSSSVNFMRKTTGLDLGESEAIILSKNMKSDLLLMDELKGRQIAERYLKLLLDRIEKS